MIGIVDDDEDEKDEECDGECDGCNQVKCNCKCQLVLDNFIALNKILAELDLIEHVSNPAIISMVYYQV